MPRDTATAIPSLERAAFVPGDAIQFVARLHYSDVGAPLSAELTITTPFYHNTRAIDIPPGRNTWIWNAGAPPESADYTVTVKTFNSLYRIWAMSSARFSVHSPPQLPFGWYRRGGANIHSSILHEDRSGLQVDFGNSYVYQYHTAYPVYWYMEVIYRNVGDRALPLSCIGKDDPSIVKAHMRGTDNSGFVAAEDTFCSRNPNFTGSLKPGGTHYQWAIFHNVPWQGDEVSLAIRPYGVSPWGDPWYSSFTAPPPAECPRALAMLDACQSGPVLMRLP